MRSERWVGVPEGFVSQGEEPYQGSRWRGGGGGKESRVTSSLLLQRRAEICIY